MIQKTLVIYLLILVSVLFFGLDLNAVTHWILPGEDWSNPTETYLPDGTEQIMVAGRGICMGESLDTVLNRFGDAKDVLPGEYGFSWYIFHEDYKNYLQIGFQQDRVVAVYTNSPTFSIHDVGPGARREDVRATFGELVRYMQKKEGIYQVYDGVVPPEEDDVFRYQGCYLHVFYDIFKSNTITSILLMDAELEENSTYYGTPSESLARSFERQNFHVTNALRVREGKRPLKWSESLHKTALSHAKDMAEHDYFSHEDRVGNLAGQRLLNDGIVYQRAGENLAMGSQNSIYMHELLMNSEGHRKNILEEYHYLGVGVSFRADGAPFLTQNYITP